jgi:hypothetical protein
MMTVLSQAQGVPLPCQNGRETAVASGHVRATRTASDLGMCRLTGQLRPLGFVDTCEVELD